MHVWKNPNQSATIAAPKLRPFELIGAYTLRAGNRLRFIQFHATMAEAQRAGRITLAENGLLLIEIRQLDPTEAMARGLDFVR